MTPNESRTPRKPKKPRTISRFEQSMHDKARAKGYGLMVIEINGAYLPGTENDGNIQYKGPATPALAASIHDLITRTAKGEFRDK